MPGRRVRRQGMLTALRNLCGKPSSAAALEPQPHPLRVLKQGLQSQPVFDLEFWISDCRRQNSKMDSAIFYADVFRNLKSAIENPKSSDYLVRPCQDVRRNREADLLCGFQIDDQLKLSRLFDGKIRGLGSLD